MKHILFALPIVSLISIPIGATAQQGTDNNTLINGAKNETTVMA
jgi:hypothetical protein|tara:strand:+ start:272 stop:403 length:132 start_codon:yes stop_codon:yes gene_type:complete